MAIAQPVAPAPTNIPIVVGQVVETLQQRQSQPLPPPPNMAASAVTAEVFGQSPGRSRAPGAAATAVLTDWDQAVQTALGKLARRYQVQGSGQSATAGTGLPVALLVTDTFGKPVSGVSVRFTVTAGNGNVAQSTVVTDAKGLASPGMWTLGAAPGLNILEAQVGGVTVSRFWAIAV